MHPKGNSSSSTQHPLRIYPVREQDFNDWITMRVQLWPYPSDDVLKEVQYLLSVDTFACFIAAYDDQPVGFIELALRPYVNGCLSSPVGFVEGVWVDERWHKRGIGRELIAKAEEWARSQGAVELASDTRIESSDAIYAHKSWGFVETERVVYFKKEL